MTEEYSVLKKSVTLGDYAESPQGAFYLSVGSWNRSGFMPSSLAGMTPKESDIITSMTPQYEGIWAGAVSIAVAKISSLSWEVQGDIPLRTRRGHELLTMADAGLGWVSFISKILQDYLLTNNGAFIEVVRQTSAIGSQIVGLIPLDSLRCTRTGDPEIPVTYTDLKGRIHELKFSDVLSFSDMPSSRASMYGVGICAAVRAYTAIYKLAVIEQYIADKVSGRRPLAIHLINGLNAIQLSSVLNTAQSEADSRGVISYMGAIMATIPGDTTPGLATINLADFPDNFNRKDELDTAILTYADNLGLDIQDIQPLTGRAIGTGAQSVVLDEKAKGKGLSAFRQQFTHSLNTWVMPDLTTMVFIENDWRDKKAEADYNQVTEAYTSHSVELGILTAPQGLQALVDTNVYPKEFLPVDQTPDTTLSDIEKPENEPVPQANAALPVTNMVIAPPELKSAMTEDLLDQQEDMAIRLVKKIHRELNAK